MFISYHEVVLEDSTNIAPVLSRLHQVLVGRFYALWLMEKHHTAAAQPALELASLRMPNSIEPLCSPRSQKKKYLPESHSLSQQNTPVALDNLFTMPLAKFSYATTLVRQSKPTWTHLPERDNLFAVLDLVSCKGSGSGVNRRNVLKVVRGGDLIVCCTQSVQRTCRWSEYVVPCHCFDNIMCVVRRALISMIYNNKCFAMKNVLS